jgi:hypothetical protein
VGIETLVSDSMANLATRRPIFHSEADSSWRWPGSVELDVLLVLGSARYGLELKYPRSKVDVEIDGERFVLRTGAPDLDRYDVLRDIARLERLVAEDVTDEGAAVALTNVPGLWQAAPRATPASYDEFRLHEGREVTGTVDWGATAGEGTKTGRRHPILLTGRYRLDWRDFSPLPGGRKVRYLLVPVAGVGEVTAPSELLR